MTPMRPMRGLYAVTPDLADTSALLARTEAALAGGVRWVQYRNKAAPPAVRREQAATLLAACRARGAALIVNDDIGLACAIGADGVHLGADDGDPAAARQTLAPGMILGVSCYASMDAARRGRAAGADYLAFGAFFASPTKPAAVRAPPELLGTARREFGLPVAAIGGITLAGAPALLAAGADLLAVISDLFDAPGAAADTGHAAITRRAQAYQRLFDQEIER